MKIIICLDERQGLLFNHRRQSKDREVIADIGEFLKGTLYLTKYSESLFANKEIPYVCVEHPSEIAEDDGVFFAESTDFLSCLDNVKQITVYWWNRHYPSDVRLEIDFQAEGFTSVEAVDLVGFSHEKITKETFKR